MNRNICIYQEFLTEAHKDRIRETARRTGFTPHFFNLDQFEEAKALVVAAADITEVMRIAFDIPAEEEIDGVLPFLCTTA